MTKNGPRGENQNVKRSALGILGTMLRVLRGRLTQLVAEQDEGGIWKFGYLRKEVAEVRDWAQLMVAGKRWS